MHKYLYLIESDSPILEHERKEFKEYFGKTISCFEPMETMQTGMYWDKDEKEWICIRNKKRNLKMSKYFTPTSDPVISFTKVDIAALTRLNNAREISDVQYRITSHYRTPAHSVEVGGSKTDAHTRIPCSAFDIACSDSVTRFKIIKGLIGAGFTRIGINENHIHADCCADLPQNVFFIERKV